VYRDADDVQQQQDDSTTTSSQILRQLTQVIVSTATTNGSQVILKLSHQHAADMTQAAVFPTTQFMSYHSTFYATFHIS